MTKPKSPSGSTEPSMLTPLRPEREAASAAPAPWELVSAKGFESCRWECADGRFVSVSIGRDDEMGRVFVADGSGRREVVESYEAALALARTWRTDSR